mgnify:CR=1 FL=1
MDISKIEIKDVNFSYKDVKVYRKNLNMCLEKGSIYLIKGKISQILNIPAISSFAVFAKPKVFMEKGNEEFIKNHKATDTYQKTLYEIRNFIWGTDAPHVRSVF